MQHALLQNIFMIGSHNTGEIENLPTQFWCYDIMKRNNVDTVKGLHTKLKKLEGREGLTEKEVNSRFWYSKALGRTAVSNGDKLANLENYFPGSTRIRYHPLWGLLQNLGSLDLIKSTLELDYKNMRKILKLTQRGWKFSRLPVFYQLNSNLDDLAAALIINQALKEPEDNKPNFINGLLSAMFLLTFLLLFINRYPPSIAYSLFKLIKPMFPEKSLTIIFRDNKVDNPFKNISLSQPYLWFPIFYEQIETEAELLNAIHILKLAVNASQREGGTNKEKSKESELIFFRCHMRELHDNLEIQNIFFEPDSFGINFYLLDRSPFTAPKSDVITP